MYLFGEFRGFLPEPLKATYRRLNQRGPAAHALVRADLADARALLEGLVGELTEFRLQRPPEPVEETGAAESAAQPLPQLPRLATALSAEAHLLATLASDARPPDTLGMARVIKLMAVANDRAGTKREAVA